MPKKNNRKRGCWSAKTNIPASFHSFINAPLTKQFSNPKFKVIRPYDLEAFNGG